MSYKQSQLERQAEDIARMDKEIADAIAARNAPTGEDDPTDPQDPPGNTPPVTPPTPVTPPVQQDEQWKQRYLTLKGKYDAEVPRLQNDIRDLKTRLDAVVATPQKPAEPTPAPTPKAARVTEKDAETFGADLLDVIKRQTEDALSESEARWKNVVDSLKTENAELKAQVTGVTKNQAVTERQMFFSKLAQHVPDWETINTNEDFLGWLGEPDPLSGYTRQDYLNNAFEQLDVVRTANIFKAFAALTPPAPVEKQQEQRSEVQRQVAPGKSKTVPASPSSDSRVWSYAEIEEFYVDVRSGKYTGKPDELAKIEAQIDLAVSTGRVKN